MARLNNRSLSTVNAGLASTGSGIESFPSHSQESGSEKENFGARMDKGKAPVRNSQQHLTPTIARLVREEREDTIDSRTYASDDSSDNAVPSSPPISSGLAPPDGHEDAPSAVNDFEELEHSEGPKSGPSEPHSTGKRKRAAGPSRRPTVDGPSGSRREKRPRRSRVDNELTEDDEDSEEADRGPADTPVEEDNGDAAGSAQGKRMRFFGQRQKEEERREIKLKSRLLEREFNENKDDYLKSGSEGLVRTITEANKIFEGVRQTADATTDSRLMVSLSDITHKKASRLIAGDGAVGIDVDEFVSKCIAYMRMNTSSRNMTSTQRQRRNEDEDSDDDTEVLDWARLGRYACFPFNVRPAVPSFLLGPLSLQKRVRTMTQRRARQRGDDREEVAPQALRHEDLARGEANTVKHVCSQIKARLLSHCAQAEEAVHAMFPDDGAEPTPKELREALAKHRIANTGGVNLFDFVVNPHSFGQTVENLFHVSFLIKEGEVGIEMDDNDMPTLAVNSEPVEQARKRKSTRHQAVFGIDFGTWRELVQAFDIKEPLIPHRTEERTQVQANGWYS